MKYPDRNKTIAVLIEGKPGSVTQTDAENLQYNLLGRGYKWPTSSDYINLSGFLSFTLLVNIVDKTLQWSPGNDKNKADENAYVICDLGDVGLDETIQFILNPPTPPADYVKVAGAIAPQDVRVFDDGIVEFWENGDHILETNKETIKRIADTLGLLPEKNLPIVKFFYPKSDGYGIPQEREVRLTKADDEYIMGFELSWDDSTEGKFKKYRRDRIRGSVELSSFGE